MLELSFGAGNGDMKSKRTGFRLIPQSKQTLRQINSKRSGIAARGPKPLTATAILSRTKLSLPAIKRILRCYADALPAVVAAKRSGLSLVTTYKVYELIRLRLYLCGIYRSYRSHADEIVELDEMSESGLGMSTNGLRGFIKRYVRRHRGASSAIEGLLVAEAAYHYHPEFTPDQFYKLICIVIRGTGPLNQAPERYDPVPFATYVTKIRMQNLIGDTCDLPPELGQSALLMAMAELNCAILRDRLALLKESVAQSGHDPAYAPGASGWRPPDRPDLISPVPHPDDSLPISRKAGAAHSAAQRARFEALRLRLIAEREQGTEQPLQPEEG